MLLLWAILFMVLAIGLFAFGLTGIVIAISFFTKITFFLSFICLVASLILMIMEKIKVKEEAAEAIEGAIKKD